MPEPEKMQIRIFTYFMCFLVWQLPEDRDQIRKQFFVLYNYCSKKNCGAFRSKNYVPKNGFLVVFSKRVLGGGDTFSANFFSEKVKHPIYAQVLVVTCPKLNSVTALL